jgi:Tfp pilus assembly protein PilN
MKPINFIKTVSPQEQLAISRWLALSIGLLAVSSVSMLFISLQQMRQAQDLCTEKSSCACASGEQQALETRKKNIDADKQSIEQQLGKLEQLTQHPDSPLVLLQAVTDSCAKNQVQLLSVSVNKNTLSLRGLAFQPEYALNLVAQLKSMPLLARVALVSLEKQPSSAGKTAFACTVSGEILSLS